jgi:hypothetical protein
MATASDVARGCIKAFLDNDEQTLAQLLSPDLDWLENGLPHEQHYEEQDGRGKWEGAHPELDVDIVDVCGSDSTAVVELNMSHGEAASLGCAVFRVADGKATSIHWYGDPSRAARILWPSAASAA